ncbi:MAG: hypothetical protein B6242_08265 [Anaerolineaceae bacterium 4572_78]|nr:MAG: hypothetical protein B6242_08265 [Anaerolineaceae bacterium 4572_78]
MIYIERIAPPERFEKETEAWMQAWKTKHTQKSASQFWRLIRQRKRMKLFAKQLIAMFHEKCAYCESKSGHVAHLHIEHFYPKSYIEFQHLIFVWENWLVACQICNQNKGTQFPMCDDVPCLVNPTEDSPHEHVDFIGADILAITKRGKETINIIDLNRTMLKEERSRWLMNIKSLLILICRESELKQEIRKYLIWAMQPDAPYSAMTKAYLLEKTPKLAKPTTPHSHAELDKPLDKIDALLEEMKVILNTIA